MATYGAARTPHQGWRLPVLPCIPIALAVGVSAAAMGKDLRWTAGNYPLDPEPATVLLITAAIAALAMGIGLTLLVWRTSAAGAWAFALGVALVCGAAIGFFIP